MQPRGFLEHSEEELTQLDSYGLERVLRRHFANLGDEVNSDTILEAYNHIPEDNILLRV